MNQFTCLICIYLQPRSENEHDLLGLVEAHMKWEFFQCHALSHLPPLHHLIQSSHHPFDGTMLSPFSGWENGGPKRLRNLFVPSHLANKLYSQDLNLETALRTIVDFIVRTICNCRSLATLGSWTGEQLDETEGKEELSSGIIQDSQTEEKTGVQRSDRRLWQQCRPQRQSD